MKLKRLSYPLVFSLTALLAACGGADTQVEPPPGGPPPPPTTEPVTPPPADTAAAVAPTAAPTEEPPPPQKTLREKLVGVWVLDFSGEVKTAAEENAKKKGGKDEKKVAELLKKTEEATAKNKVENTADSMALWEGDKTTSKSKYEVVKEEGNAITVKYVGKDEITKKDAPKVDLVITFRDDNTIELKDPKEKDAKKAKILVFKRGEAAAPTAADAKPAEKGGPAPAAARAMAPAAKPAAPPEKKPAAPPEKM